MPFQPGNTEASKRGKDKPWADALRLALMDDDKRKLRAIAEKCTEAAMGGDMQAIKEIGDRLDGKPAQSHEHGGPEGGAIEHIHEIRTTIVDPRKRDSSGIQLAP